MNYKECLNYIEVEMKKIHPDWDEMVIKQIAVFAERRCFDAPCDNCDTDAWMVLTENGSICLKCGTEYFIPDENDLIDENP